MKALIVKPGPMKKILDGSKSWEIRRGRCHIRGLIGLIESGSGEVVGVADLADCIGPLKREQHTGQLSNSQFVNGFGSFGGEEFFSYLNISDSLHRTGGPEWDTWNRNIKTKMLKLQNEDGTWAGHHCITGRAAVTSAAILTLLAERDPVALSVNTK